MGSGAACFTLAVVAASSAADPARDASPAGLELPAALAPDVIVLLRGPGLGEVAAPSVPSPVAPGSAVWVFPGPGPAGAQDTPWYSVDCLGLARLFLVPCVWLADEGTRFTLLEWFRREVDDDMAERHAILLLDTAPWLDPRCQATWSEIISTLGGNACRSITAVALGDTTAWWDRIEGLSGFTLRGPAAGRAEETEDAPAASAVGLFWGTVTATQAQFRLLRPDSASTKSDLSRSDQELRLRLRRSLGATPTSDASPQTTVTFANPTAQTLDFRAAWHSARGGLGVDPQILGFRLRPGETFEQQFRFTYDRQGPLKFQMPALVLSTVLTRADGIRVPLELPVRPWCRMTGTVAQLSTPPRLDGDTSEWRAEPGRLSDRSQVVSGRDWWRGPDDLSAGFMAATDSCYLYLAAEVRDLPSEPGRSDSDTVGPLTFYVGLTLPGPDDRRDPVPLAVSVWPDGRRVVESGPPSAAGSVQTAASPTASGFVVEVAIPTALFAPAAVPDPLLLDLAIEDRDTGDPGPKIMYFSGNQDNRRSCRYMGGFTPAR